MKPRTVLTTLVLLLAATGTWAADQTATWNGTTGNWSDAARWSTNPLFPNNGNGGFTYDAVHNAGTLTMHPAQAITIEMLTMTGGVNAGSGFDLTLNDLFTWSSGGSTTLNGAGNVNANGGVNFSGSGTKLVDGGRVLNLGGTSTWSAGNLAIGGGSVIRTMPGATLVNSFDGAITRANSTKTFDNQGVFTKSAGTGTTTIGGGTSPTPMTFSNTGTVNVNSGTLSFVSTVAQHVGATLTGGTWNVSNGSTLTFSTGSNITTIDSGAAVGLDGATSTFNRLPATASSLATNLGGFTLKNGRSFSTAGPLANSGAVRVENAATILTINGNYTQAAGSTTLVSFATLTASTFHLNGGTLAGEGEINCDLVCANQPVIAPGNGAGTLAIDGNATLTGTLAIEIGGQTGGTEHDYLDVQGALQLNGCNLDFSLINGFVPAFNDVFFVGRGSGLFGAFANVASGSRLQNAADQSFRVDLDTGSGEIVLSQFIDSATQPPKLTAPGSGAIVGNPIGIAFSLPESALAGSLKLTFTGSVTTILTLAAAQGTAGAHTFNLLPADLAAAPEVASVSGLNALPDGVYALSMQYQDASANAPALHTVPGVTLAVAPYSQWKVAHLGNVNAPDTGNDDADAFVTLAEYGLVLVPTEFSPGPAASIFAYPDGTRLRIIFTRDPARNDVTVEVEATGDLVAGPWLTIASSVLGAPTSGLGYFGGDSAGPGLKTVEVRDVMNVGDPPQRRRFLRFRVTR